jgi:hypothetical protein
MCLRNVLVRFSQGFLEFRVSVTPCLSPSVLIHIGAINLKTITPAV